ncbi:PREDICTED: putative protein TPRXL [Camelina sativa]|uniref:CHCH domain-containing protein n=1 Tax=Camelina sativa TaxID=90675 RepID=A0ABM1RE01_CAMSA|nr:PREDICTED: putative protein TPRXL [Camelina sativa]
MPRRRHEDARSSSSSSSSSRSSPSPRRTERRSSSSSSPRPAASRSRSRDTSGSSRSSPRPSPRPRPRPAPSSASSTARSSPQPRPAPVAASAPRSSPKPRPAPASTSVSSSAPPPAPARSSSSHTERSTTPTYSSSRDGDSHRAKSDKDEYSLFHSILRSMRRVSSDRASRNDRASSSDRDRATSHGETQFRNTVQTLLCPAPRVVSNPLPAAISPCDTQSKAFQNCLHEYEADISKCQFYMSTLSQCKKNSDFKLYDVAGDDPASSVKESRFLIFARAVLCPRGTELVSQAASIAPVAAPVAVPINSCDTQDKTFQNCLHEFGTDISKCQLYMNMLSRCKKNSDS